MNQYVSTDVSTQGEAAAALFQQLDYTGVDIGSIRASYTNLELQKYKQSDKDKFDSLLEKITLVDSKLNDVFEIVKENVLPKLELNDNDSIQFSSTVESSTLNEIEDGLRSAEELINAIFNIFEYLPQEFSTLEEDHGTQLKSKLDSLADRIDTCQGLSERLR